MGKQAVEKSKEWGPGKTAAVLVGGGIAMVAIAGDEVLLARPFTAFFQSTQATQSFNVHHIDVIAA